MRCAEIATGRAALSQLAPSDLTPARLGHLIRAGSTLVRPTGRPPATLPHPPAGSASDFHPLLGVLHAAPSFDLVRGHLLDCLQTQATARHRSR